ncbi:hypothetical protein LVO79_18735 (plasmid) [Roseivivax marinus]|uniref:hypothetical protein n=1 Tax=Roseivivax marinus TaxID=1379903 RepID=UPI001F043E7F|nr:hypothetical protein [Roseivivax marinus]UMA67053.1 hypothetical protein LVO79_18735 [Roseivivax marinus]
MPTPEHVRAKLRAARAIPPTVRAAMSRAPEEIAPGAIDVLDRFYHALSNHRRDHDCPPRSCYDAAAKSEPTLATLLLTLERFAPELSLAEGRVARKAWYRRRKGGRRKAHPVPLADTAPPECWPTSWHPAYSRLIAESPRESTALRYINSLTRCAQELSALELAPTPDRFRALLLGEAFGDQGLSPRTVRNYVGAFLRLAQCLGADEDALVGIADIFAVWRARAARAPKQKDIKLDAFAERGGTWHGLLDQAVSLCAAFDGAGGSWRASRERGRLQAAVLIIAINTTARTGDIAAWRVGRELIRKADGSWSLRYRSKKSGHTIKYSRLWPETHAALDAVLLAGRPARMLEERYAAVEGRTWMRHGRARVPSRYPSELVKEVASLSAHPLRTLAADVLRRIDPGASVDKTAAWLGQSDLRSQDDYAVAPIGRTQCDAWARVRDQIRRTGA